ncbi:MAG: hypothetical protein HZR80_12565 [Candidatus Heimdallarchaeota archaeon]
MKNINVYVRNKQGEVNTHINFNFDESKIYGKGPEFPEFIFYCIVECDVPKDRTRLTIHRISGEIRFHKKKIFKIGNFNEEIYQTIESHPLKNFQLQIQFPMNNILLEHIEKYREGDIKLEFVFFVFYSVWDDNKIRMIEHSEQKSIYLDFPESVWIKAINDLGFFNIKILQIPYPEEIKEEKFQVLINHLNDAKDNFYLGKYNDCIADCRYIIEGIQKLRRITVPSDMAKNTKNKLIVFCDKILDPIIGKEKTKLFKNQIVDLWGFTSRFHHVGYKDITDVVIVNRSDAEYVLISTSNILSYLMKIFGGY